MVFGGTPTRLARGEYAAVFSQFQLRSPRVEPSSREKFFARAQQVEATWCHQVSRMRCGRKLTAPADLLRVNHYVNALAERGSGRANDTSARIQDGSMSWASPHVDARHFWPIEMWHSQKTAAMEKELQVSRLLGKEKGRAK